MWHYLLLHVIAFFDCIAESNVMHNNNDKCGMAILPKKPLTEEWNVNCHFAHKQSRSFVSKNGESYNILLNKRLTFYDSMFLARSVPTNSPLYKSDDKIALHTKGRLVENVFYTIDNNNIEYSSGLEGDWINKNDICIVGVEFGDIKSERIFFANINDMKKQLNIIYLNKIDVNTLLSKYPRIDDAT